MHHWGGLRTRLASDMISIPWAWGLLEQAHDPALQVHKPELTQHSDNVILENVEIRGMICHATILIHGPHKAAETYSFGIRIAFQNGYCMTRQEALVAYKKDKFRSGISLRVSPVSGGRVGDNHP